MTPKAKPFGVALCVLAATCLVQAQSPTLSISSFSPDILQFSWPSNFVDWQLAFSTNLDSGSWQRIPLAPVSKNDSLLVYWPISDSRNYFRLQRFKGAGSGVFQATPPVITAGGSSTLTWSPQPGYTYWITPGPGIVTGGSLVVAPTNTTVYSLTASNAAGFVTGDTATVFCNPCGWLQVTNVKVILGVIYNTSQSTPSYSYKLLHFAHVTFDLHQQSVTATDAIFFGFGTRVPIPTFGTHVFDSGSLRDREDDKSGPGVFTTTENSPSVFAPVLDNVCTLTLHVTCSTFDFSYNILGDITESTPFGNFDFSDGLATGRIGPRPLGFDNDMYGGSSVMAAYPPPATGDYFTPSSDVGKRMFTTGTATAPNAGNAEVTWYFLPQP